MKKPKPAENPDDFYLGLLTRGERQPFSMNSPYDGEMRKIIQMLADNILDYVRAHLQETELAPLVQPGRIVVTTIPQATVQALTVWIDPVHSIAVNHGLMLFMYRVARALAPHIITRGPGDPPAPPESEAVSIVATLIDWMSSPARAPLIEDWPAGERETRTADNIATAGERFVVSHEIAHIIRRHLIVDRRHVDVSKVTLQELSDRPYAQEIEADVIGAMQSIESMMAQKLDPRAGAVGVVTFLHALHLAEEVGAIVLDGKHPPAALRLETLRQALPRRYGADFATIFSWADQMGELIARVGALALAERNARNLTAVAYMERVFREHSSTQGLDRNLRQDKAMLDETLQLLRTSPSVVLEAVAKNLMGADEYRAVASAAGSPEELHKNDRARRHSIAHFIGRYLPVKVRPVLGIESITFTDSVPKAD